MSEILSNYDVEPANEGPSSFMWICTELWTDVFKMMSRRQLVQAIQPVGHRFKQIADKNVGSVHVIEKANDFIEALAHNQPLALEQYANLTASNCSLGHQFRLTEMDILVHRRETETNSATYKRRRRYQMCVMRHCLDLFNGARLSLNLSGQRGISSDDVTEYYSYLKNLEPVKLACIGLYSLSTVPQLQMYELFKQPTILNSKRLILWQSARNDPGAQTFVDWLHHCPTPTENNEKNDDEKMREEGGTPLDKMLAKFRCLWVPNQSMLNSIEEILDRCVQNLQQAEQLKTDGRPFLFVFCPEKRLTEFRVENSKTGEVLALEYGSDGLPRDQCRLRRCLADEEKLIKEMSRKGFQEDQFIFGNPMEVYEKWLPLLTIS